MSTNYGLTPEQRLLPSVARLMSLKTDIMQSLRVALPGIVQSFDPGPPATVKVLIPTNEPAEVNEGGDQFSPMTRARQIMILEDVQVMMPGAGPWTLTFPIQKNDECLVVFADVDLDVWWEKGDVNNYPISHRRHDLSDAVAIFGWRSTPRGLPNYSTTSTQLRNDDQTVVIDLTPSKITITAPNVEVDCSGQVKVNADTVDVEARAVTIGRATTIDGKVFLAHTHGGVTTGEGFTTGVA